MADAPSPNDNIPAPQELLPLIVIRGNNIEQLQHDLNRAFFAGYEPEPGLMCTKGNEIWVICVLQDGPEAPDGDEDRGGEDAPVEEEPSPPDANPHIPGAPAPGTQPTAPGGNVNERVAAAKRGGG